MDISDQHCLWNVFTSETFVIFNFYLLFSSVSSGCISTFVTVYTEDGLRKGLYRGLSINYMRVVPQVAVMFSVYEIAKQVLNDSTVKARSEWVLLRCSGTGIQKLHKALINSSNKERNLWAQGVIWVRQRDLIKYNYWKYTGDGCKKEEQNNSLWLKYRISWLSDPYKMLILTQLHCFVLYRIWFTHLDIALSTLLQL